MCALGQRKSREVSVPPADVPDAPAAVPAVPADAPAVVPDVPADVPAVVPDVPAAVPEVLAAVPEVPAAVPATVPDAPAPPDGKISDNGHKKEAIKPEKKVNENQNAEEPVDKTEQMPKAAVEVTKMEENAFEVRSVCEGERETDKRRERERSVSNLTLCF